MRKSGPRRAASLVRRPQGTGSLLVRCDRRGRETWYGKWRAGDRQVMRRLGLRRQPGESTGLTRRQAEAELRKLVTEDAAQPAVQERLTLETLAERYLAHKETAGLRRSTLRDYACHFRVHLIPFFGGRSLDAVTPADVEAFIRAQLRQGLARKTVDHHLGLLSALYRYGVKRGYARLNPVELADRPRQQRPDADVRYLTTEELEALLRAVPPDYAGGMERVLYLAAAMTGMRRGECVALRWRDVDWTAGLIRVRRSYGDGEFGPPKSRRSSRAVPMADRVAAELDQLYQQTRFQDEEDLVFCHPHTGGVYDPSKLRKRFAEAAQRAGIRPVRFHDLRHTFGTQMAAAGAPLRAIQEWMGHTDYRTTSIYADYAPDPTGGARYAAIAFGKLGETPTSFQDALTVRAQRAASPGQGLPVTPFSKIDPS
jgi:integrase